MKRESREKVRGLRLDDKAPALRFFIGIVIGLGILCLIFFILFIVIPEPTDEDISQEQITDIQPETSLSQPKISISQQYSGVMIDNMSNQVFLYDSIHTFMNSPWINMWLALPIMIIFMRMLYVKFD